MKALSVNQLAYQLAQKLLSNPAFYGIAVSKSAAGAIIIDAGVKATGGFEAGKILTELCLGAAGQVDLGFKSYGEIDLPSVTVTTDFPAIACLGSQFAGWRIKENNNIAIGSGPARAIALKPKEVYEEINYTDQCDKTVIVLESNQLPTDMLIEKVTTACNVAPENLIIAVAPTASIAGLTQVTGRIVEVGIHKLKTVGLDPKCIKYAMGYAPISPSGPDFEVAMARTNDAMLYGGTVFCAVEYDDDAKLQEIVNQTPSMMSKDYGKPFLQIFREADKDFYKIDHNLFAPALIIVNSIKTGKTFKAGKINTQILLKSLGF
ncbi:MAG: methenyltetrahydromethanopterin cyclohydrolase [Nitrososphaerota archaeon]|jgi:methenyltetrahydromethanopterin cyclohydrolase|uniref:methenyltetrahydromethanopterin cyclohydrolase n=1 Tax=Candidatus Bathycorpusculum sp. TaxID=2994959 RepID=UPI00281FD935|nr:methenyltetrahydromethanopterin cyclohydrolase [Candidatus Termiticorpusculum sp.]MCL2257555.1 methenyltetrahydromethanopterin cyclohydrolase [Candidatus Termiticorpusculum sp.]MCL2292311.1 methenyltetrahydromethanopterin cyclohydrolase [Candidatus Termiticorpusculum sp.]MDR0460254.1 methenyltetrahydromethanopterin cyclohydrolase [Nitrososphaerota archaeon]